MSKRYKLSIIIMNPTYNKKNYMKLNNNRYPFGWISEHRNKNPNFNLYIEKRLILNKQVRLPKRVGD